MNQVRAELKWNPVGIGPLASLKGALLKVLLKEIDNQESKRDCIIKWLNWRYELFPRIINLKDSWFKKFTLSQKREIVRKLA